MIILGALLPRDAHLSFWYPKLILRFCYVSMIDSSIGHTVELNLHFLFFPQSWAESHGSKSQLSNHMLCLSGTASSHLKSSPSLKLSRGLPTLSHLVSINCQMWPRGFNMDKEDILGNCKDLEFAS